ncbi:MAG: HAD-IB family phosphatase [Muribaculaceae bacterium]|nr:HAD-IB family phosphatase [Muribaculaceae bacterium]
MASKIIASDFDGTITTHDTLPLLLKYCFGKWRFAWGVVRCLPWILLYKLHIIDGGPAKERLMRHFFEGMPQDEFSDLCAQFASAHCADYTRPEPAESLRQALSRHDSVLVVTASMSPWVRPWLDQIGLGDARIIGTEMEIDAQGRLTGQFATPNCNGEEKWRRMVEAVPEVQKGLHAAYGDTSGDKVMLSHATEIYYRNFETPQHQLSWWKRHSGTIFWTTLCVLVLYQMLGVFFGMDVADAGFYLTFYDNIFSHPSSVEYNFMYYLSGVIGGAFQHLFPGMGMLGMRLLGVAFNTSAAVILYYALRRHIDERAIALGCALVVVSFIAPPYTLSYDLCTVVFYVAAITALWRGMEKDKIGLVALAGALAGLNILVRIPNVLGLSMALIPPIRAFIQSRYHIGDTKPGKALMSSALFLCCAAAAVGLVLWMMPQEHFTAFKNVINDLRAIAADTSGTASHTTGQMMMTQFRFYGTELWTAVKLAVPVTVYWLAHIFISNRWLKLAVKVAALALFVWFVARMHPLQPLWVMCMAGCIAVIVKDKGHALTWMAILGLGMMLVMPLGSDGAYNNGSVIAWSAAPVAATWWIKRVRVYFPIAFLVVCAVRMVTGGAYFDGGSLLDKRCTVNNDRATCIFTTAQRAQVLNTVLEGIQPYVKPGTTLMAYGSIPTLNYLTRTRPYLGCSWVEQLSAGMLQQKLQTAAKQGELPLVLRQKFNTIGTEWGEPSETYLTDYGLQNAYQDNSKLKVLNQFLDEHHYQVIYEDTHFVLCAPHR